MNEISKIIIICFSLFFLPTVYAMKEPAKNSPIGFWKTIDDTNGQSKSIVQIWEMNNVLYGKVIKLFSEPNKLCTACDGVRHNQPIIGMTMMDNFKHSKENANEWNGGNILDPKNGKTYHSLVRVAANGQKLNVRGYIGMPLFGRSQTWVRVESLG